MKNKNPQNFAIVRSPDYLGRFGEIFWLMKRDDPRFGNPDYEFSSECSRKGKIITQPDGTTWELCSDWSLKLVEFAQPIS